MADKTVVDVNPNVKVTDNGDNTWSVSCEDVNSDDALTALEALVVDAAAIEVATEATQAATEAMLLDTADIEVATEAMAVIAAAVYDAVDDALASKIIRGYELITVTIANGASVSNEIDLRKWSSGMLYMPAAWTAANVGFIGLPTTGGDQSTLYDDNGSEVLMTVDVDRCIPVPSEAFGGFTIVRSGTVGTPVAQGAERVLYILVKG